MARLGISGRDLDVLKSIVRFKWLATSHIYDMHFHGLARTTLDRSLKRLQAAKYINAVERYRLTGGRVGGSGQYVWVPTASGYHEFKQGAYRTPGRMSVEGEHALDIANLHAGIMKLHHQRHLVLHKYLPEPDCHVRVERFNLAADLFEDIEQSDGNRFPVFFEIDEGHEWEQRIVQKLLRYTGAYRSGQWHAVGLSRKFPVVVFICKRESDVQRLQGYVDNAPAKVEKRLFRVMTQDAFLQRISTPRTTETY